MFTQTSEETNKTKTIQDRQLDNAIRDISGLKNAIDELDSVDTNFANTDLTLTGDRTHSMASFGLSFINVKNTTFSYSIAPTIGSASFNIDGFGSTSSDMLARVRNGLNQSVQTWYGDRSTLFDGNIGVKTAPISNVGIFTQAGGLTYGQLIQNGSFCFGALGGTQNNFYSNDSAGASGYICVNPSGGSASTEIGYISSDFGANIGGSNVGFRTLFIQNALNNVGFQANVTGATNNIAIDIQNGDIRLPSSAIGLSGTFNFNAVLSGQTNSMTFEKGVLISTTQL